MQSASSDSRNESLLTLAVDVGNALTRHERIAEMLQDCAQAIVNNLGAAFARIWVFNELSQTLELVASAGLYTHLNGAHGRIPLGQLKIGQIALEKVPHLTNDVLNDDRISDHEWAEREGIVAFAGHPLLIEDRLVGVMALFARHPLKEDTLTALAAIADTIALGVKRKATEEELFVSERRYRAVFDTAPDGIITVNEAGVVESANAAAHNIFGLSSGEMVGHRVIDVMPDFFGMHPSRFADQKLLTGEKRIFGTERELTGWHKDGHSFPVELSLSVTNLGRTSIFTAIVRDITARKGIESKLREREGMFTRFAESVQDIFWVCSPTFDKHYYVSPSYEEIWGRSLQDLYAHPQSFRDYLVPEDREKFDATIGDLSQLSAETEFRIVRPDGSIRWLWVRKFPIYDDSGNLVQVCGLSTDNTERKEAETRVSEFYSMVSHELRTPLTSIRAALGLIEAGLTGGASDETMDLVHIARMESDRLIRLINDILDMRKMEAGKLELNIVPLSATDVVESTIAAMRGFAQEHEIEVRSVIEDVREILGDRDRVLQVLTNLLSNAIKFSSPRSSVEVRAASGRNESYVRFSVTDKGPGIPANKIEKLFGLFQQLDSSDTRARGGTGLGLAISKAIVERLGGTVGLESTVNVGSTFWFELPCVASVCYLSPVSFEESDRDTIKDFLAEYARSLPGWIEELQAWLKEARTAPTSKVLNNCLLRVRKIRGSAEPCGFPDIAEKMRQVEFALSNIIENSSNNVESDWQAIEAALATMGTREDG